MVPAFQLSRVRVMLENFLAPSCQKNLSEVPLKDSYIFESPRETKLTEKR
jgi:hypothetical protein